MKGLKDALQHSALKDKILHAGADKVNYQFTVTVIDLTLFEGGLKEAKVEITKENKFSVLWKRGTSSSGKTDYIDIQNGALQWSSNFSFNSTMYKGKKGFEKKIVSFELEHLDWRSKSKILGKGELDVAQFCFEEMPLKKDMASIVMNIGGVTKKQAMLNIIIEAKNLDVKITEQDKERFSKSFRAPIVFGSDNHESSSVNSGGNSGDLEKEIASLKKKLKNQAEEYDLLNEDFEKFKEENGGDGDEQTMKLKQAKLELEVQVENMRVQLDKEIKAKESLRKENENLSDLVEDAQKDMVKAKKDLLNSGKSTGETEPSQKEKNSSNDVDNSMLKRKMAELEKQIHENEELREERDLVQSDFLKMKNKAKSLEEQIKVLQSKGGNETKSDNLRLVQELNDVKQKLEDATKDRDLMNRDLQTLKKGDSQSISLERFVLDNAVLFSSPEFQKDVPISLKVIYLCMCEWQVFDSKKNATFLENFTRSLEFVLERHVFDLDVSVYWLVVAVRLLGFMKKDYANDFNNVLEHAQDIDEVTVIPQQITIDARKPPPDFITAKYGKSRFGTDPELNVILFIETLLKITCKHYLVLISSCYDRIDKILLDCATKIVNNQNLQAALNDYRCGLISQCLDEFYSELKKQGCDAIMINHFFETIGIHIDEFLFNHICSEKLQSGKIMQIKMTVSSLESWFDGKAIVTNLKRWFLFTRQGSDVCMIQDKSLINDNDLRMAMFPNLSPAQIGRLLSNCGRDLDPNGTRINNDGKQVLIKSKVNLYIAMDPSKRQPVKGCIFNVEMNLTKQKFANVPVPPRYLEKVELEFLL